MISTNKAATPTKGEAEREGYNSTHWSFRAVRHSRLASPVRRQIRRVRDALRVVRRKGRNLQATLKAKWKSSHLKDGIGARTMSATRKLTHELRDRRRSSRRKRKEWKAALALSKLTDGEFILVIAELLFQGRGANPAELEQFKRELQEDPDRRFELIERLLGEHYIRMIHGEAPSHDPHTAQIMGTRSFLTRKMWQDRAAELGSTVSKRSGADLDAREFKHTGEYIVTAIASLYKGRRHLEKFLENITSQSMFDKSELIIIDANSPEGEEELIGKYLEIYPNIVYKKVNYRIGIYDAWNDAIGMARGRYLTNTNLDDLRRVDSFELQAAALDDFPFADVVYQDFFYSFDSELVFEDVAKFGYKSLLPTLTANNLLRFNSPHNAPMWRARLHQELGLFDPSFKSAGDYEFWLRCALNGKRFYKLNTPHVIYFQNPDGISTSSETQGVQEARRLMNMYARKLASRYLKLSRAEFAAELGIKPQWSWETPLYNVVQGELARLNQRIK